MTLVLKIYRQVSLFYKSFYCAKVLCPLISQNYVKGQEIAIIHYLEKVEVKKTLIRNTLLSLAFKTHMPQFFKLPQINYSMPSAFKSALKLLTERKLIEKIGF